MSDNAGKLVCVTGASGYLASWLVKLLLQLGYTVRATVGDSTDPERVDHLLNLDGAKERLHLIKANLLDERSFDHVVEGCDGVFFHTVPPSLQDCQDRQTEPLDLAVKGTLKVLTSCAKFRSVKRVVLTSCISAVHFDKKPRTPEVVVDESWFSDPDFCRAEKLWYALSKTLAEEAAWKFTKENNIDMVTINPATVIGPLLQQTLPISVAGILKIINGQTFPNFTVGWINVKDVANAHIKAFEVSSANGRYCLVERMAHFSEVVKILRELYPQLPLPKKCENDKSSLPTYEIKCWLAQACFELVYVELIALSPFVLK
ncbi:hypothetical protein K1719_014230 [Acacia pycnantha]|nr:hypothetical protein K1719_014230 [Acacia pycnantha]